MMNTTKKLLALCLVLFLSISILNILIPLSVTAASTQAEMIAAARQEGARPYAGGPERVPRRVADPADEEVETPVPRPAEAQQVRVPVREHAVHADAVGRRYRAGVQL